eukprot:1600753-Rhodomonas_salina.2
MMMATRCHALIGILLITNWPSASPFTVQPIGGLSRLGGQHWCRTACPIPPRHSRKGASVLRAGEDVTKTYQEVNLESIQDLLDAGIVKRWLREEAPAESLAGGARGAGHSKKTFRDHREPEEIYVVGTSHLSEKSAADVTRVVRATAALHNEVIFVFSDISRCP